MLTELLTIEQRTRIVDILNGNDAGDWMDFDKAMEREIEMQLRYSKTTR